MLFSPVTRTSRSADLGFEIRGFARRPTGGTGSPNRPCWYFYQHPQGRTRRRLGPNSAPRKTLPNLANHASSARRAGWMALGKSGPNRTKADISGYSARERPAPSAVVFRGGRGPAHSRQPQER